MKKWQKYLKYLETGDWHVHTRYTDGRNSVPEMCRQAQTNGLKLIAFTEHVRKELSYDFGRLVKDVKSARKKFPKLKILVGCEAKVTDSLGSLDVSKEVMEKCDIVLGTFHTFPCKNKAELENALINMIKNPDVDIWTHPITFFQKCPMREKDVYKIIKLCIKNNVLIENNIKPRYHSQRFIDVCRNMGAKIVTGSDAHGIEELRMIKN
ncbi:MAG: PHP domain-containing protein [Candidatus Aenigmatarchaeota archaeon]